MDEIIQSPSQSRWVRSHPGRDVCPIITGPTQSFLAEKYIYVRGARQQIANQMGRKLVREHEHTEFSAQIILSAFQKPMSTSTQSRFECSKLQTYPSTAKYNPLEWKGSAHSFILNWLDQARQYNDMVPEKRRMTPEYQVSLLQTAVAKVQELHAIREQEAHDIQRGKPEFTFEQYMNLLLSAATTYDENMRLNRPSPKRTVHEHEMYYDPSDDYDDGYDDDDPYEDQHYQVHATIWFDRNNGNRRHAPGRRPFGPRLTREQWYKLSAEAQKIWDQFSPNDKATILGKPTISHTPTTSSPGHGNPFHRSSSMSRRIHLHDMSASDLNHISAADFIQAHMTEMSPTPSAIESSESTLTSLSADLEPDPPHLKSTKRSMLYLVIFVYLPAITTNKRMHPIGW